MYAARFNERLLAAVRVTLSGTEGALDSLRVREVTRRRGVGRYCWKRFCVTNPSIHAGGWRMQAWKIAVLMTAFMRRTGLRHSRAAGRSHR
ncbi:aspartate 1-decarboxylase autocleavage activator PanM [Escherichia coli]